MITHKDAREIWPEPDFMVWLGNNGDGFGVTWEGSEREVLFVPSEGVMEFYDVGKFVRRYPRPVPTDLIELNNLVMDWLMEG